MAELELVFHGHRRVGPPTRKLAIPGFPLTARFLARRILVGIDRRRLEEVLRHAHAPGASHLSPDQLERFHSLLVDEYRAQQARSVELADPVDLEPDLADVLLARCREAIERSKRHLPA